MRAFVTTSAGQKIGGEDLYGEPRKDEQLKRTRRAANEEIKRKRRQRDHAAQKPRCDKGAVPRRRQCILLRRRMDERLDILPYWREQAHVPNTRPVGGRAPLIL